MQNGRSYCLKIGCKMLTNYENLIGEIQTNQQKEELDLDSLIFHLNKLKLYWLATDQHLKSGYDLNQTIYYQILDSQTWELSEKKIKNTFPLFRAIFLFCIHPENIWKPNLFRGYKNETLAYNGFIFDLQRLKINLEHQDLNKCHIIGQKGE